jgi:hypothetical protein
MTRSVFLLASLTLACGAFAADTARPLAHANADHPAVAIQRLAAQGGIDPNTFLVQPPASVVWTPLPAPAVVVADAAR